MQPDYFLVLPWHFREGIVRREGVFARGGRMIFLPRNRDRLRYALRMADEQTNNIARRFTIAHLTGRYGGNTGVQRVYAPSARARRHARRRTVPVRWCSERGGVRRSSLTNGPPGGPLAEPLK